MSHVDLKAFENLLRTKAATWSERAAEYRNCGLRAVVVGGDRLRNALCDDGAQAWLDEIFAQLPPDAVIMDADFGLLHMSFNIYDAGYMDSYFFIVASKEWEALEEGAVIPEFEVAYKKPELLFMAEPPVAVLGGRKPHPFAAVVNDKQHYWTGLKSETYCNIRREAISPDELHMHSTSESGTPRCDKITGIGQEPSRADLFRDFSTALLEGNEERMRIIGEQIEAQSRREVSGDPLTDAIKAADFEIAKSIQNAPGHALENNAPHILYEDENVTIGTYGDPENLSPAMQVAALGILEAVTGAWLCDAHLPPFMNSAERMTCEICNRSRPK